MSTSKNVHPFGILLNISVLPQCVKFRQYNPDYRFTKVLCSFEQGL